MCKLEQRKINEINLNKFIWVIEKKNNNKILINFRG